MSGGEGLERQGREMTRKARKRFVLFAAFRGLRGPECRLEWERALNALVCEVYGLTKDKIAIISAGRPLQEVGECEGQMIMATAAGFHV